MKNKNKKDKLTIHDVVVKRILPLLAIPFILSGCAKRSECDIKDDHVHLYTKTENNAVVKTYMNSEYMKHKGYDWTSDSIKVTADDLAFYKVKGEMFEGEKNWDCLYNKMASCHDYLEYYYTYDDFEYMPGWTDEDGNEVGGYYYWDTTTGWTTDINHRGVNGTVRVRHPLYYGYKITYENGKYVKEKSPYVNDFREIISDYPYINGDKCVEYAYSKEYDFDERQLPSLRVEDVSEFKQADLSYTGIYDTYGL